MRFNFYGAGQHVLQNKRANAALLLRTLRQAAMLRVEVVLAWTGVVGTAQVRQQQEQVHAERAASRASRNAGRMQSHIVMWQLC